MEILYGSDDMSYLRPLGTRLLPLLTVQGHHSASLSSLPCIMNFVSPQDPSHQCPTLSDFSNLKTT